MKFSLHKLPKDSSASSMRKIPVTFFKAFSLMMAPVYTLLERNEKFVAVKAPLGFFSPVELEKFRSVSDLYLPVFIKRIEPFQEAGAQVARILGLSEVQKLRTSKDPKEVDIPVSPFQMSDAVLQVLGPLWGSKRQIEPFFLSFLASEVCDPISESKMAEAFEQDVARFELAVLRSGLGVFIALHLGFLNRTQLSRLRDRVFDETMSGTETLESHQQVDAIAALVHRLMPSAEVREVKVSDIEVIDFVTRRLKTRLERVIGSILQPNAPDFSLYGAGGICDGE